MAINYDLILKYLVKKEKELSFTNQKNFMTYSDKFPNEFKNILGDKFYRMGVTQNNEQKNISFYTSLITLLDDNIMLITEKEEIHKVNQFLSDINNKIRYIYIHNYIIYAYINNNIICIYICFNLLKSTTKC